ncbi:MAG: alanine--glyoxylate aminotransferase family protein [Candidatus Bipolaricaulota bacterium]|nr:alanine--glyoxylate aminotransferase family protein [Candidatus Bipolaricaulota bacterium]MCS7275295.1 alanine--glyoxylate aminotransferase family protein [Candidatus Bipolaricaulota bacterium]MDW8111525.1 alanine--glyoxylate aminotransferase family protein [Candidatus Bipolaricaulota bacterium]MDW8329413.1 alanine--glyoxylate aminotransferase family protein [Candidatus Bipolaricaulota bacterium]
MKRYRLRIPGPVEIASETLAEMAAPLTAHYGSEWVELYTETLELCKRIWRTERGTAFLMPGPGSAGMEAAIVSLSGEERKFLMLTNGFFGDRWIRVARSYEIPLAVLEGEWGRALDPDAVEQALKRDRTIRVVVLVHGETSTGVLNPLREIAAVCRRYEAILIVDTVATLGGEEIAFDEWGIGIGVSASQKCLGCPPGLAPIAISPEAWALIERGRVPGWYLNLRTWREYAREWGSWHPHPVTMPTGLMRALRRTMAEILDEGLDRCVARHMEVARALRRSLLLLGLEPFVSDHEAMNTVTAVKGHAHLPASAIARALKEEHQILVGGGLERLAGQIFRIGHMGPTATYEAMLPVVLALEQVLQKAGIAVQLGAGPFAAALGR